MIAIKTIVFMGECTCYNALLRMVARLEDVCYAICWTDMIVVNED